MVTFSSCGINICKKTFFRIKTKSNEVLILKESSIQLVLLQKYRKIANFLQKLHIKVLNLFRCRIIKF